MFGGNAETPFAKPSMADNNVKLLSQQVCLPKENRDICLMQLVFIGSVDKSRQIQEENVVQISWFLPYDWVLYVSEFR